MATDNTSLVPHDQKKGLVRSREDEVLLEKINCFQKKNKDELQKWSENNEKRIMQRHFLQLCKDKLSITESQLKTLNDKELARLGKIIAEKAAPWARFQTIAAHTVLWGPILAGLFLMFSVVPEFLMLGFFSLLSFPIFFGPSARNYRKIYLKICDQYGEENFPADYLRDT